MEKLTDSEKEYLKETDKKTSDILATRILNATRYINEQIAWLKKDHPDKWVTIILLKTILNYISYDRITININWVKYDTFQKNMTHHEIVALTKEQSNQDKVLTYGNQRLFPDEEMYVEDGLEFTI